MLCFLLSFTVFSNGVSQKISLITSSCLVLLSWLLSSQHWHLCWYFKKYICFWCDFFLKLNIKNKKRKNKTHTKKRKRKKQLSKKNTTVVQLWKHIERQKKFAQHKMQLKYGLSSPYIYIFTNSFDPLALSVIRWTTTCGECKSYLLWGFYIVK